MPHDNDQNPLRLSTFEADITPPLGSPLCGGWIRSVEKVSDPLRALGLVLEWGQSRIVLCALDWCEVRNEGYWRFQNALAEAVFTPPEHVAVQCVHPHNAPFVDPAAQRLIDRQNGLPALMDEEAFQRAVQSVAAAAQESLLHLQPVTRISVGQAEVEGVASNRRVRVQDGSLQTRWSACTDATLRAEPEGLIDPKLTSLVFWGEQQKRAVLHYYATHPMSYYGDGDVTPDFMGLARQQRVEEDGGTPHLVFTGGAGNITAGKYNDGLQENRSILTRRIHAAMVKSEQESRDIGRLQPVWRTCDVHFQPRSLPNDASLRDILVNEDRTHVERSGAALEIAFREGAAKNPVTLSCLSLNERVQVLHLPGEPFVEYQLYAQSLRPDGVVAFAGYGDCGVGYLPLAESFEEGGYEPRWAFAVPATEDVLKSAIRALLD